MEVPVSSNTKVTKVTIEDNTQVKRVVVGRPVRRVNEASGSLSALSDVDLTNLENGSLLIYSDTSEKFEASRDLEEQNINGGSY